MSKGEYINVLFKDKQLVFHDYNTSNTVKNKNLLIKKSLFKIKNKGASDNG